MNYKEALPKSSKTIHHLKSFSLFCLSKSWTDRAMYLTAFNQHLLLLQYCETEAGIDQIIKQLNGLMPSTCSLTKEIAIQDEYKTILMR